MPKVKFEKNVGNSIVTVMCTANRNAEGFFHRCKLFVDGKEMSVNTEQYINRTWECWEFQTAIREAVKKAIAGKEKEIRKSISEKTGKIITAKNPEYLFAIEHDGTINTLKTFAIAVSETYMKWDFTEYGGHIGEKW